MRRLQGRGAVISQLLDDPAFADALGYVVNYDREREFLREQRVRTQSTLIVFKNGVEVRRSVGETTGQRIRTLFKLGL